MKKENERQSWQGKNIEVNILYTKAGLAQQIWVRNENGSILFDTGDGILRDIISNELDITQIRGIVFTHGHFDHIGGLHSLLGFLRMKGRNTSNNNEQLTMKNEPNRLKRLKKLEKKKQMTENR